MTYVCSSVARVFRKNSFYQLMKSRGATHLLHTCIIIPAEKFDVLDSLTQHFHVGSKMMLKIVEEKRINIHIFVKVRIK
jgi:hypothetical protein